MRVPSLGVRVGRVASLGPDVGSIVEFAVAAEEAGADAFVLDEAHPGAGDDPFVLLGAIAAKTQHITLGCVANVVGAREPSLIAKSVAALDVVSNGRALACLALGQGSESDVPFEELAEALTVVRLMLDEQAPSFAGSHYSITGAFNEPRAKRRTPMALGYVLPAPGTFRKNGSPSTETGIREGVFSSVDYVVTKPAVGAPPSSLGGVSQLALVEAIASMPPDAVALAAQAARDSGYSGTIIDWPSAPSIERLADAVRAVSSTS